MVVWAGKPVSRAANGVAESFGAVSCAAVAWPYAVVVPNSKNTFTPAPAGLTAPLTTAVELPTELAPPVTGVSGPYASANRPRSGLPFVNRKNGVPTSPPWHAAPSPLNGVAMQPEEIGSRTSASLVAVNGTLLSSATNVGFAAFTKWPKKPLT